MIYEKKDDVVFRPIQGCPNFKPIEFACPCGMCNHIILDLRVPALLQKVRSFCGNPITINRGGGYRCPRYNEDLIKRGYEASPVSRHLSGQAADITIGNVDGQTTALYLYMAGARRIGIAQNWSHFDVGQGEAYWFYRPLGKDSVDYFKKKIHSMYG